MRINRFQCGDHEVLAVPVLTDNFVYLVCRDGQAVLIDAGEAAPVLETLEREQLQLVDLLITHTHHDHVGGCRELHDRLGVLATSPGVEEQEQNVLGTRCRSISTPGHMAVHKCYYFEELGILFSGDTLINGACGRVLGGTIEQLYASLQTISQLPNETTVFGGHDYLADNLAFARGVEPDNQAVEERLALYKTDPAKALFATLKEEKRTNPFLRVDTCEAFIRLRAEKDRF